MYLHINDPKSVEFQVIDLLTGIRIPGIQEVNDETGEFTIILKDLIENTWIEDRGEIVEFKFKGQIKIVPV